MKIIKHLRAAYREPDPDRVTEETVRSDINTKVSTAVILSGASLLLTVLNIFNHNRFMLVTTAVLTVGFAFCAVLCGVFKKRTATNVVMAFLIAGIFSVYALTGENEGFAILWILLVPLIAMNLIGLRVGTALSFYFQVFLCVLFWSPVKEYTSGFYTKTFQIRFPVLYLTSFLAAVILAAQKEYYFQKTENMAYLDKLTELFNRRYYDLMKNKLEKNPTDDLCVVSVDINRLKYTNDTLGHRAGDELIMGSAGCIREAFSDALAICRTGGDEFMVLICADPETVGKKVEALRKSSSGWKGTYIDGILLSIGWTSRKEHPDFSMDALEKEADSAMYRDKDEFYKTTGLQRRE